MEGQILKAFDIKELFIRYDVRQLSYLVRDSFETFKIDFKVDFKFKDVYFMDSVITTIFILQNMTIDQIKEFIPYLRQTIRYYENNYSGSQFEGVSQRIETGNILLLLLDDIITGKKIWKN